MTLTFILLCFITNFAWILLYKDLKKENKELKNTEIDLPFEKYVEGRNDERYLIQKQFTYAKTPEEFCDWVYTYYFTDEWKFLDGEISDDSPVVFAC